MSPLGKKVEPPKPAPAKEVWRAHKPGFEIGPGDKLRTVDVDTAAEDYIRALTKRSAP